MEREKVQKIARVSFILILVIPIIYIIVINIYKPHKAPETKTVYLMHTTIRKGADTGDMNIKDYYSIQDELYDNIMKSYIKGN